jgi:hypothetical protein
MVAKGNKDAHKMTYTSGVKAVETMKWGASKARERYGDLTYGDKSLTPPKDLSAPQKLGDANNLRGPPNDCRPVQRLAVGKGS